MAHAWQLAESGRRNYAGSALQLRNGKLKRAARISPVRKGDPCTQRLSESLRVMTAAEYVANGAGVAAQIDAGREANLLVLDVYNEGGFLPVSIYDVAIKHEYNHRGALTYVEFDLHAGLVLVKPDTLIYWK